jgi:ABC-type nickel/cobalt efflux system permease component RcnA
MVLFKLNFLFTFEFLTLLAAIWFLAYANRHQLHKAYRYTAIGIITVISAIIICTAVNTFCHACNKGCVKGEKCRHHCKKHKDYDKYEKGEKHCPHHQYKKHKKGKHKKGKHKKSTHHKDKKADEEATPSEAKADTAE